MKKSPTGAQAIHCAVGSCAYNETGKECNLGAIQVSATPYGNTGKACDESMCASYRTRG